MIKVLVTGANGFIGSHMVELLLEDLDRQYHVCAADVAGFSQGVKSLQERHADRCSLARADMRDWGKLRKEYEAADVIVNLAATLDGSVADMVSNNVDTAAMLSGMSHLDFRLLIHASSAACYAPQLSHYAATKSAAENILMASGIKNVLALRFFNVYGPHAKRGVIPTWLRALRDGRPIRIDGSGTDRRRNYVYVGDVVRVIEAFIKGSPLVHTFCGLGRFGESTTLFELLGMMAWVTGKTPPSVELHAARADTERELWTPHDNMCYQHLINTPLSDGLALTWDAIKKETRDV